MKTTTFFLLLSALPLSAQLSQGEREYAMSQLHATRKMLLDSLAGLSAAQWKFKPAPDRWSIEEIAEHLVLTEGFLFDYGQKLLKTPAVADRKVERGQDEQVYRRMADRANKVKAVDPMLPSGKYANAEAAGRAFREVRDRTIRYVETTTDPLRAHTDKDGSDAYQCLLMIAGHTERHVGQIGDVKSDPRFPK
jgi:uncharacterized damage-inducible protein DinB